jgi:hypothetical protein
LRSAQQNWLQSQPGVEISHGPSNPTYDSGLVQNTNLLTASIAIFPDAHDDAYATIKYGGMRLNAGSAVNNSPSDGDGHLTSFGSSVGG